MAVANPGGGVLAVEVTRRCHRQCRYCYNSWKGPGEYAGADGELPAADLVRLAERAVAAGGFGHVQITGGEPLLRADLFEIVGAIKALGVGVSLVTDGSLIDSATIEALLASKVHPVQTTLLAADRDVHDGLKGSPGFDATVGAIGAMVAAGVPVSVAFVCTAVNASHFKQVLELAFALGVRSVAFNRFCWSGEGAHHGAELVPSKEALSECLRVARWGRERLSIDVRVAIALPHCAADEGALDGLPLGRCAIGSETPGFTIDPMGHVRACSISATVLGDLKTESWETIVERARAGYLEEIAATPAECAACESLAACGGGCRESAFIRTASFGGADPLLG